MSCAAVSPNQAKAVKPNRAMVGHSMVITKRPALSPASEEGAAWLIGSSFISVDSHQPTEHRNAGMRIKREKCNGKGK